MNTNNPLQVRGGFMKPFLVLIVLCVLIVGVGHLFSLHYVAWALWNRSIVLWDSLGVLGSVEVPLLIFSDGYGKRKDSKIKQNFGIFSDCHLSRQLLRDKIVFLTSLWSIGCHLLPFSVSD